MFSSMNRLRSRSTAACDVAMRRPNAAAEAVQALRVTQSA